MPGTSLALHRHQPLLQLHTYCVLSRVLGFAADGERWGSGGLVKQNTQRNVNNRIANGEAKELICMTHGHEQRGGGVMLVGEGCRVKREKGEKKMGQL